MLMFILFPFSRILLCTVRSVIRGMRCWRLQFRTNFLPVQPAFIRSHAVMLPFGALVAIEHGINFLGNPPFRLACFSDSSFCLVSLFLSFSLFSLSPYPSLYPLLSRTIHTLVPPFVHMSYACTPYENYVPSATLTFRGLFRVRLVSLMPCVFIDHYHSFIQSFSRSFVRSFVRTFANKYVLRLPDLRRVLQAHGPQGPDPLLRLRRRQK